MVTSDFYSHMARDRLQTEERLLAAVHDLISTEGFDQLRINRLAQQAKVNKILIYRYFGGLNGLLEAYYEKYKPIISTPLIDVKQLTGVTVDEFFDICTTHILDEFRHLRANPQAQEFLKNDLMAYKPGITNPLAARKEEQLRTMIDALGKLLHTQQARPISAILVSAMTMLTFMAQDKRTVFGVDLGTDDGWADIEKGVRSILKSIALAMKERIGEHIPDSDAPSADGQEAA
jgi:AcrR family transcriptional regulator